MLDSNDFLATFKDVLQAKINGATKAEIKKCIEESTKRQVREKQLKVFQEFKKDTELSPDMQRIMRNVSRLEPLYIYLVARSVQYRSIEPKVTMYVDEIHFSSSLSEARGTPAIIYIFPGYLRLSEELIEDIFGDYSDNAFDDIWAFARGWVKKGCKWNGDEILFFT
ncbi:hypothetical protein H6G41_32480 [Tolypothrix sp. FACHB-123]|uniref:hypothetical protein n=1 Tax=Tolypothrix sp. FACHB-123 TaxID=2692868 RepID=UPI00168973E6|nr:hypothetical protein [Tolypothrix sp. FACHB-123]MBD2359249.1 hypothetical protein [Tolypothrix sp. FACHB-123]